MGSRILDKIDLCHLAQSGWALTLCSFVPKLPSLSELRDYRANLSDNRKNEDKQEQSSSPVSGVSGQAVISLLTPEELEKLLEEVKSLDEATLKVCLLSVTLLLQSMLLGTDLDDLGASLQLHPFSRKIQGLQS